MARDGAKDKPVAVSVLVVAYQSGPHLADCLAAIEAQTFRDFEIVVVDNASTDGAPAQALAAHPSAQLIEAGSNLGFAAGMNLAARHAQGRWLALINPDAFADPDWLQKLVAGAEAFPAVHCFTSRQLLADDPGFPWRGGYRHPDPGPLAPGEVFSACGGAMMISHPVFDSLGGFDERLFCYGEDVDLGYRLRLQNEPTLLIPDAIVRHHGGTASGGPRSDFAVFHGTRNRLWVYVKDTPALLLWLTLPLHILTTIVLFARHATRGELTAPWKGLIAGLKDIRIALEARRETQPLRKATTWQIASAMTWNPLDLLLRRSVIKRRTRSSPVGGGGSR